MGTHTEHRIGAICHVEKAGVAMLEDLFRFEKRAVNPLAIDPKARWTLLRSVIPYWVNRNLIAQSFPFPHRIRFAKDLLSGTWFTVNEAGGIAHFLPDYESILELGTEGLRERVIARRTKRKRASPASRARAPAISVSLPAPDGPTTATNIRPRLAPT